MARKVEHTIGRDEYLEMAEDELEQAIGELNTTGEVLEPRERVRLAQVYALTSIARALQQLTAPQQQDF